MDLDFSGLIWFGMAIGFVLGVGTLALFWWIGPLGVVVGCAVVALIVGWLLREMR